MAPELNNNQASAAAVTTKSGRAFVTFLAGEGDYVKGVVGLAKGLRKVKSSYPLVVAVLPCVPPEHRRLLEEQGCILKPVDPVQPPVMDRAELGWAHEHFAINYSKLRIWEFVEFSKMIYFDGDIQIYGNVDHLFDLPDGHLYAVLDCFCDWYHSPQYKVGYCQQSPNRVTWPSEMGPPPSLYFNAGMFMFEPNLSTYDDLLNALSITPPSSFAEQDLLNMFFKNIYKPIPSVYNLLLAMLWQHPESVELDQVKAVHFCATGSKPWRYTGEEDNMKREDVRMLVEEWWNIYDDPSLDYKQPVLEAPSPETAESESKGLLSRVVSGTEDPNLRLMAVA